MRVILEVISGPGRGQRIRLHQGLIAKFGQTEWADYSFPVDAAMAEFHFQLDCRGTRCVLQAFDGAETFVNSAAVSDHVLTSGDRVLAGQTEFLAHVEGMTEDAVEPGLSRPIDPVAAAAAAMSACEIGKRLGLRGAGPSLAAEAKDAPDLSARLAAAGDFNQALHVRAFTLGRRPAVAWGCQVVDEHARGKLQAVQSKALAAAKAWYEVPGEATCRAAESAAGKTGYQGVGGWLAAAAFWSGDNIAPAAAHDPIAPDDSIASRAVAGALTLALNLSDGLPIGERYLAFIDLADRIESGDLVLYEV